jgi:hypothetical protein
VKVTLTASWFLKYEEISHLSAEIKALEDLSRELFSEISELRQEKVHLCSLCLLTLQQGADTVFSYFTGKDL